MSDRCKRSIRNVPVMISPVRTNCICSFTDLIKLILIILQFSNCGGHRAKGDIISNDILFIIALYFLSCTGCTQSKRVMYICERCGGYYY